MTGAPRVTRTYRLQPATIAMLDSLSRRTCIPQSILVDRLLEHLLAEEAAGRLTITRRPVVYELDRITRT